MNYNPLVSVIMNCCNGEAYLREAVDSVLSQSYKNWEIIFWDNCSKDKSVEIIQSYKDKRIKCFKAQEFTALGKARNLAIEKSRGEIIAFLDVDDIWYKEKLLLQVEVFIKKESVGIVVTDTIFFDKDGDQRQLYSSIKPKEGNVFRALLKRYDLSLETVAIRRKHLDLLVEWFDVRFDMIEEAELLIRLSKKCELAYIDKVLAKWRMHDDSWTFSKYEKFPVERELMIEKFCKLYPNFEDEYSDECMELRKAIAKERALLGWKKSDLREARAFLRPYLGDRKMLIYFLLTFLPKSIYDKIQQLRGFKPI